MAALTPLPCGGGTALRAGDAGLGDSLYFHRANARGIPVATVAIGNAKNAGLLAVQILAAQRPELLQQVVDYRQTMTTAVMEKQARLDQMGVRQYLDAME